MMESVNIPTALPALAPSGLPGTQPANKHQPLFSDIFSAYFSNQPSLTLEQLQKNINEAQEYISQPVGSPLLETARQPETDIPFELNPLQPALAIKDAVNYVAAESNLMPAADTGLPEQTRDTTLQPAAASRGATTTALLPPAITSDRRGEATLHQPQPIKRLPEASAPGINKEQSVEIEKVYERLMPLQADRYATDLHSQKESSTQKPAVLFYGEQANRHATDRYSDSAHLPATSGNEPEQPFFKSHRSIPLIAMERTDQPQLQALSQAAASNVSEALKPQGETRLSPRETTVTAETKTLAHSSESMNRAALANPVPKLGQRVLQMISRGESSIEIRLDPPDLGKLTLSLSLDRESLNLQITTSNSAVRDLLMTHDGRLRQALAEQGISLSHLDVNVQSEQHHESHQGTSSDIDTSGIGVLADGTEVDQSFTPGALLFKAQGGRLLDQFI